MILKMRAMKKYTTQLLMFALLYGTTFATWACDPAEMQWEKLYKDYDHNRDQQFDMTEWVSLIKLENQSYQWQEPFNPLDPTRNKIFLELDQDHNKLLSQEEMYNIYRFFPDPCADWHREQNEKLHQQNKTFGWSDWLKSHLN